MKRNCVCKEILEDFSGHPRVVYIHLLGCPEDYWTKEYEALPWYKKIFTENPEDLYFSNFPKS